MNPNKLKGFGYYKNIEYRIEIFGKEFLEIQEVKDIKKYIKIHKKLDREEK